MAARLKEWLFNELDIFILHLPCTMRKKGNCTSITGNIYHWRKMQCVLHDNYNNFLIYFCFSLATTATTLDHLSHSISSDQDGNPPLYITKRRKNNQDHVWINNALVIRSRSNVQMQNENGKKQVRPTQYITNELWVVNICKMLMIGLVNV